MEFINWNLMRHPLNWVTIFLMLFIAGIALHFIMQAFGINAPDKNKGAGYGSPPASAMPS